MKRILIAVLAVAIGSITSGPVVAKHPLKLHEFHGTHEFEGGEGYNFISTPTSPDDWTRIQPGTLELITCEAEAWEDYRLCTKKGEDDCKEVYVSDLHTCKCLKRAKHNHETCLEECNELDSASERVSCTLTCDMIFETTSAACFEDSTSETKDLNTSILNIRTALDARRFSD